MLPERTMIPPLRFFTIISFISIAITSVSVARSNLAEGFYKPITEKVSQRRSTASGSRSPSVCNNYEKLAVTLLVPPQAEAHLTATTNPSFYISVNLKNHKQEQKPASLLFNLINPKFEEQAKNPLFQQKLTIDRSGIYQISLPKTIALKSNELYLWQIGVPCAENNGSIEEVLKAGVKKVDLPQPLEEKILAANNQQRSLIYKEQQIWYDALNEAYQTDYFKQLIKEIDVTYPDKNAAN